MKPIFNVTLSDDEQKLVFTHVMGKRNKVAACDYAGIRTTRLKRISKGTGTLTIQERKKLLEFCELVQKPHE